MMRTALLALVSAGLGGLAGYGFGRAGWRHAGVAVAAALAAGAVLMVMSGRQSQGWDGIAQVILAVVFLAPGAAGLAAGLWLGLRGRNRG